ncbi:hypothetical protein K439DRAFT_1624848 [Ramaria rubella]|nr:hypothetical protein K439DRAFT_1624848 [Ramaria rubella]
MPLQDLCSEETASALAHRPVSLIINVLSLKPGIEHLGGMADVNWAGPWEIDELILTTSDTFSVDFTRDDDGMDTEKTGLQKSEDIVGLEPWRLRSPSHSVNVDSQGDRERLFGNEADEIPPSVAESLAWAYDVKLPGDPPLTPSGYFSEISSPVAPGPDGHYSEDRTDSDLGKEGFPRVAATLQSQYAPPPSLTI